jgi:serine protease
MRKIYRLLHVLVFMAMCSQAMAQAFDSTFQPMARVIVKFKDDGNMLRRAAGVERATSLTKRLGFSVSHVHEISSGHQVMKAANMTSEHLAAKLSQLSEVAFAEPDERLKISALPNDPMFPTQWYLQNKEASSANFLSAWDTSRGEQGTVVAVIDTVITDHPDLQNKLVPGYNMNGVGRSNNPSDPGDYIDSSVRNNPAFVSVCGAAELAVDSNSSWHGTQVASLIAAQPTGAVRPTVGLSSALTVGSYEFGART